MSATYPSLMSLNTSQTSETAAVISRIRSSLVKQCQTVHDNPSSFKAMQRKIGQFHRRWGGEAWRNVKLPTCHPSVAPALARSAVPRSQCNTAPWIPKEWEEHHKNTYYMCIMRLLCDILIVHHKSYFGQKAFYSQDLAGLSTLDDMQSMDTPVFHQGFWIRVMHTPLLYHTSTIPPCLSRSRAHSHHLFRYSLKAATRTRRPFHSSTMDTIDPHKLPRKKRQLHATTKVLGLMEDL